MAGSGTTKIVKSLEKSGLLIKGVNETVKNEAKDQKGGFLSILLGTLVASLLGNLLTGKGRIRNNLIWSTCQLNWSLVVQTFFARWYRTFIQAVL